MRRLCLIASLVALTVLVPFAQSATVPTDPCKAKVVGDFNITVSVGGLVRTALVHVPAAGAGRPLALVLAFHGAGGSGPEMEDYSGMTPLADRDHFIVVYPSAAGQHHYWTLNTKDPNAPDDIAFMQALLQRLPGRMCMDPHRVYATGVSNGGGFTARVGCVFSQQIAAIAPVAGGYRSLDPCTPARPVAVLEIHGTSDPVVPYDGRPPDYAGSVPRFLGAWASIDQCPDPAQPVFVAPHTERFDWGPCAEGTEVLHFRLSGVGHTWPGAHDSKNAPIVAGRTIWRFFRAHALPAAP